jgi:hypothetical protein
MKYSAVFWYCSTLPLPLAGPLWSTEHESLLGLKVSFNNLNLKLGVVVNANHCRCILSVHGRRVARVLSSNCREALKAGKAHEFVFAILQHQQTFTTKARGCFVGVKE